MSELVLEGTHPDLPDGWKLVVMKELFLDPKQDIVDGPFGSNLKAAEYVENGVPLIRLQNVSRNRFIDKNIRYISEKKAKQLRRHNFVIDDIVITKLGEPVGKACMVPNYLKNGIIVADIVRMRINHAYISKKYLTYLINSEYVIKQFANNTKGTTRPRVNLKQIREFKVPLPPLNEQKRIVAKIQELFPVLDFIESCLMQIKIQLKIFKQAILRSAYEGKLTENWRTRYADRFDPNLLLEKIKEKRKEIGIKEKSFPEISMLEIPHLPQGWIWTRVGEIGIIASGSTPKGINSLVPQMGNIPFYKVSDMNKHGNELFMKESKIHLTEEQIKKLKINIQREGTIIFPKRGGAIATNKKRILSKPSCYDLNLMGVYPIIIPFMYFYYWILKIDLCSLSDGSNVPQINHDDIEYLLFPLSPIQEAEKIVQELENKFSLVENIERTTEEKIKQSIHLRQSILKTAFQGKLIPQDPNDEPAEILLQKLKQEKQTIMNQSSKSRGRKNVQ